MLQLAPCLLGALYTADGGSKLAVQPVRLVRLLNSVYGSEHLLLFGREEECLYAHSSQSTHPQLASAHSARTVNPQRAHTPRSTLLAGPSPRRPDQLMSTLLAFDQAAALEAELGGSGSAQSRGMFGDLGLTGKLLARTDFFEAVARQSYGPWELAQRARRARVPAGGCRARRVAFDDGKLAAPGCTATTWARRRSPPRPRHSAAASCAR